MGVPEGIKRAERGRVGVKGTLGWTEGREEVRDGVLYVYGVSGIDSRGEGEDGADWGIGELL
jgi:hypothetical protein